MKRRWFTVGGVVEIAIAVGAAVLLHEYLLDVPMLIAWVATFLVSGVLAVLGGEGKTVAGLGWRQLIGLSYVVFALGMMGWQVRGALAHPGDVGALATAAALVLGGSIVAFMGFDLVRGPKHFDLSGCEPGPILFGSNGK